MSTPFEVVEISEERTVVIDGEPTVVVEIETVPTISVDVVSAGMQGPAGPQGPPGPDGVSYEPYVYDRAGVPAATWTIAHNLGRRVHVTVLNDDGTEVDTDVEHPDLNHTTITFAVPTSGIAILG